VFVVNPVLPVSAPPIRHAFLKQPDDQDETYETPPE
jgi:hypothetical protein